MGEGERGVEGVGRGAKLRGLKPLRIILNYYSKDV
jgi:hypothetical protein